MKKSNFFRLLFWGILPILSISLGACNSEKQGTTDRAEFLKKIVLDPLYKDYYMSILKTRESIMKNSYKVKDIQSRMKELEGNTFDFCNPPTQYFDDIKGSNLYFNEKCSQQSLLKMVYEKYEITSFNEEDLKIMLKLVNEIFTAENEALKDRAMGIYKIEKK